MRCRRCAKAEEEARYRAVTDLMDIEVCHSCAEEASRIGISIRPLSLEQEEAELKEAIAQTRAGG